MKKTTGKLISLLLAFVMLAGMLPITASATGFPYNAADVAKVQAFLSQEENGETNADILGWTIDNPGTWGNNSVEDSLGYVDWTVGGRLQTFDLYDIGAKTHGSLDLSGCEELTYLDVDYHNLTGLDLTGCSKLETLYCSGNQLTTLNLSGCSELDYLGCSDNRLTTLDLTECTALETIFAHENPLSSASIEAIKNISLAQFSYTDAQAGVRYSIANDGSKTLTITCIGKGIAWADLQSNPIELYAYPDEGNTFEGWSNPVELTAPILGSYCYTSTSDDDTMSITANFSNPTEVVTDFPGTSTTPTLPAADGAVQVEYSQSGGEVSLTMPESKISEIIEKSDNKAVLDLSGVKNATTATLPKAALTAFADAGLDIEIKQPQGTITLSGEAAASVAGQATGASISVELKQVPASSLNAAQREAINDGDTVIDISILSGTQKISTFNGTLTVTVPYTGELPAAVWYLNDAGELEKLSSTYNAATKTLSFTLNHLSLYVVGPDTNPFTDVKESDWFCGDVEYVYKNGLMQGTGAATFSPQTAVSRAMVVTVLWRLDGEPEATGGNPFTDLTQDWYADAVIWAAENGIVEGYGGGLFGPDDSITREQLAVMLCRYCEYKGIDISANADLSGYSDANSISDWALDAVKWANAEGLITGRSATSLAPRGTATRAELAAILHRFCKNVIG